MARYSSAAQGTPAKLAKMGPPQQTLRHDGYGRLACRLSSDLMHLSTGP